MEQINLDTTNQQKMLKWVDKFDLSRPKKNLRRDFSDAVLLAEILSYEFPKSVELHNYPSCSSLHAKLENWNTLNLKVLRKFDINLKQDEMEEIAKAETNCIEKLLFMVMKKIKSIKKSQQQELKRKELEVETVTKQIGDHVEVHRVIHYSKYDQLQKDYRKLLKEHENLKSYTKDLEEYIKECSNVLETKTRMIQDLDECYVESKKNVQSYASMKESLGSLL